MFGSFRPTTGRRLTSCGSRPSGVRTITLATSRPQRPELHLDWADGLYFRPRMAEEKQCVLVLIGADEWGAKEILGLADGDRESSQSWRELLLDSSAAA